MAKGDTPRKLRLDNDAQDLVAQLGITPMTKPEIAKKYGRSVQNVHYSLLPRARTFARMNGIVIERPIPADGYMYKARWEWTGEQRPNWSTMLTDLLTRTANINADLATYAANAAAEGRTDLAAQLEDIYDLSKVTTRSVAKARLLVEAEA
jgi:hypothetical protein